MEHLVDCHTHTWYSADGRCTVDELCDSAQAGGLAVVAVTDHFDYAMDGSSDGYLMLRKQQRAQELELVRQQRQGQLEVLRGIEIGQPHWNASDARTLANCGDFDLVIGSIHDLRPGKSIYHDFSFITPEACDRMYHQFFAEAREMVETCDFDVFGHYDYPMRVMGNAGLPADMRRWEEPMEAFLRELAQSGISLEVNTCGLRRWMGCTAGVHRVLEIFRRAGGRRVTIGSDAHYTRHVGAGVKETCAILRQCGFDSVTVYRQRKPVELSI